MSIFWRHCEAPRCPAGDVQIAAREAAAVVVLCSCQAAIAQYIVDGFNSQSVASTSRYTIKVVCVEEQSALSAWASHAKAISLSSTSLKDVFTGAHAVVCAFEADQHIDLQLEAVSASTAAGVKRFVPSEYFKESPEALLSVLKTSGVEWTRILAGSSFSDYRRMLEDTTMEPEAQMSFTSKCDVGYLVPAVIACEQAKNTVVTIQSNAVSTSCIRTLLSLPRGKWTSLTACRREIDASDCIMEGPTVHIDGKSASWDEIFRSFRPSDFYEYLRAIVLADDGTAKKQVSVAHSTQL